MTGKISVARRVAYRALTYYQQGKTADEALAGAMSELEPADSRDRALATTLVYGTIRRWVTIDYILSQYIKRPLKRVDPPVLTALRLGIYQLFWLDRVPEHAVVNETVEQAKKAGGRGVAGFVNGVLRAVLRSGRQVKYPKPEQDLVGYLSTVYSHPAWLVQRYLDRLGRQETEALLAANNQSPPLTVRVNKRLCDPEELATQLRQTGAQVERGLYLSEALRIKAQTSPSNLPGFKEGLFTPQDEASMLVVHILNPLPGEMILDACAAPGTKTGQIGEHMDNRGTVVALDPNPQRVKLVAEAMDRLRLTLVTPRVGDARDAATMIGHSWAHRILVDAPCSGLGTLARRPDLRWRKQPEDILSLARLQGQILDGVAPVLRRGGELVYSTCTTEPEENQEVITAFLSRHKNFKLLPPVVPHPALAGAIAPEGWLQLWPHRHQTDGFFVARMQRVN